MIFFRGFQENLPHILQLVYVRWFYVHIDNIMHTIRSRWFEFLPQCLREHRSSDLLHAAHTVPRNFTSNIWIRQRRCYDAIFANIWKIVCFDSQFGSGTQNSSDACYVLFVFDMERYRNYQVTFIFPIVKFYYNNFFCLQISFLHVSAIQKGKQNPHMDSIHRLDSSLSDRIRLRKCSTVQKSYICRTERKVVIVFTKFPELHIPLRYIPQNLFIIRYDPSHVHANETYVQSETTKIRQ